MQHLSCVTSGDVAIDCNCGVICPAIDCNCGAAVSASDDKLPVNPDSCSVAPDN